MGQDYTKHDEGRYKCRITGHEVGTKTWGEQEQDELRIHFSIDFRETGGKPDMRFAGDNVTASVRLTPDEKDQKKFFGWLKHLGFTGRIPALDSDRSIFTGKVVDLECSHWESPKNGNRNEFWNVPRADSLKPINAKRLESFDADWAAVAPAVDDDPDLPF